MPSTQSRLISSDTERLRAMASVVLGAQFGDEGKGKLVDVLCKDAYLCARSAGGNNAGHTVVANGTKYEFHLIPSGLVYPTCIALLGSAVVVHLPSFFAELDELEKRGLSVSGRVLVSDRAHLVCDFHQVVDGFQETELGVDNIGTTRKGIGPAYTSKATRNGLRIADVRDWPRFVARYTALLDATRRQFPHLDHDQEAELLRLAKYRERLLPHIVDAVLFCSQAQQQKNKIVVEGANALLLDLDYGTYPFVTSSSTGIGGAINGLAISPFNIKEIIGVVKAYTTRVGSGPLPTELFDDDGRYLQEVGREFGVVTKRKRRCGWLDLVLVKYSAMVNNYTSINLTKLDVLDGMAEVKIAVAYTTDGKVVESFPADIATLSKVVPEYKIFPGWPRPSQKVRAYSDLPRQARYYVEFIEDFLGIRVETVGVGPDREDMLLR